MVVVFISCVAGLIFPEPIYHSSHDMALTRRLSRVPSMQVSFTGGHVVGHGTCYVAVLHASIVTAQQADMRHSPSMRVIHEPARLLHACCS